MQINQADKHPKTYNKTYLLFIITSITILLCLSFMSGPDGIQWPSKLIFDLRLRRFVLALLTGASLASAGLALQKLLQNPLADPFVVGVSGGAAVFGSFSFLLLASLPISLQTFAVFLTPISAFIGASFATLLLLAFMKKQQQGHEKNSEQTILLGVILNSFAAALITLLKSMVSAKHAQDMLFWLIGTLSYPSWTELILALFLVLFAYKILWKQASFMDLIELGDVEAIRLGIDPHPRKRMILLASSFFVAAVIPLSGMIAFIGLVIPHLVKTWQYRNFKFALFWSSLAGATALASFDALSRLLFETLRTELPVGALTALFGSPILAYILWKKANDPSLHLSSRGLS